MGCAWYLNSTIGSDIVRKNELLKKLNSHTHAEGFILSFKEVSWVNVFSEMIGINQPRTKQLPNVGWWSKTLPTLADIIKSIKIEIMKSRLIVWISFSLVESFTSISRHYDLSPTQFLLPQNQDCGFKCSTTTCRL